MTQQEFNQIKKAIQKTAFKLNKAENKRKIRTK